MALSGLTWDAFMEWMPDNKTMHADIVYVGTREEGKNLTALTEFQGMQFLWKPLETHWFQAEEWVIWTAENWTIPIVAVVLYFLAIAFLKHLVATKGAWNVRSIAFYWNTLLSLYSWLGVFFCAPVLLSHLRQHGLYFSICAPATYYGEGVHGLFVLLFVYSKIAELFDTILLVLANKPVLTLQWWHHSTVLLYCWHSYAVHIATGLWFATMNYAVHSVMYGYFAITGTTYRKVVTPYAIFITLGQFSQMLVGMFVTIKAIMYQTVGQECHVNKTNSILGLLMYFSYAVLFGKLLVDRFCRPAPSKAKKMD